MIDHDSTEIRERRDTDLAEIGVLLSEVHASDGYPVEGVADPVAWLRSDAMIAAWVAVLDGALVGHIALSRATPADGSAGLWAAQSGQPVSELAVLGRLFVGSRARGNHIGRRLVTAATGRARELSLRAVLDVMVKDGAAIRTYENLGWQRLGSITHHFGDNRTEPALAYVSP